MIYQFKTGVMMSGVSAQTAGEVCESLESDGMLTPGNLVDVSRPEDAPLHKAFEWDDNIAAEKYRETQASYIIRSIEVVPESIGKPTRAWVSLGNKRQKSLGSKKDVPKRQYHAISRVMNDDEKRARLLEQAYSELRSFKRKYETLSELASVFTVIDELVTQGTQ